MIEVTKGEAGRVSRGEQKMIRRAFNGSHNHKVGDKVPLVLKPEVRRKRPDDPAASHDPIRREPVCTVEVVGVIEHTVDQMNDARAREEGYRDLSAWKAHWEKLYAGTNRVGPNTTVYALRIRRTELNRKRVALPR